MSTEKYNIFDSSGSLSEQEIKDYLSGKLSKADQHAIEQKMQNSQLELDAMEGFSEHPDALDSVDKLKAKLRQKMSTEATSFWSSKLLWAAASFAGIIIVSTLIWVNLPTQNNQLISENMEQKNTLEKTKTSAKEQEDKTIDDAQILHDSDQIKSEEVIQNTPITLHLEDDIENEVSEDLMVQEVEDEEDKVSRAFAESFNLQPASAKAIKVEIPEENIVKSNVKTRYINSFLVIDYSDTYTEQQFENSAQLSGTPAKYKSLKDTAYEANKAAVEQEHIDYTDYLALSLSKYKNDNYKSALKNFNTILEHYPEDLNAHFYGGLCYYNIDNPLKAIDFFDFILNQNINTFHQEAQYYKAMCLIRMGKTDEAKFILQKIVQQDGFFADKARELLERDE